MIAALPLGHAARADPLDRGAEHRIAAHQQAAGPRVALRRQRLGRRRRALHAVHGRHTTRKPML